MTTNVDAGIIVPDHVVEIYVMNGWRLTDEPCCGGARVTPPYVSVNRVPATKTAGRARQLEPAKIKISNDGFIRTARRAQHRVR
jgi:hypothetical protein